MDKILIHFGKKHYYCQFSSNYEIVVIENLEACYELF